MSERRYYVYFGARHLVPDPCCGRWRAAHEDGTDNEGYGQLVHYRRGTPRVGTNIRGFSIVVKFCPWCAAPKKKIGSIET